jgi:hypothetical protein
VIVRIIDESLILSDANQNEIARHTFSRGKGKLIGNNNYNRDYSLKIDLLINRIAADYCDPEIARQYLNQIRKDNPRYIRDQLTLIKKQAQRYGMKIMEQSLNFCLQNNIFKATDLESVAKKMLAQTNNPTPEPPATIQVKSLSKSTFKITPEKSSIADYKNLMN